jgi:hypothetical protein
MQLLLTPFLNSLIHLKSAEQQSNDQISYETIPASGNSGHFPGTMDRPLTQDDTCFQVARLLEYPWGRTSGITLKERILDPALHGLFGSETLAR